jgi:hypothetical protein
MPEAPPPVPPTRLAARLRQRLRRVTVASAKVTRKPGEGERLDVRAEVARTLTPVKPLASPERRVLPFLVLGALWLACVPMAYGIRYDAHVLGVSRLWLLSVLQLATAGVLFRYALALSIPGRLTAPGRVALWAAFAATFMLAVTAITFAASPIYVPPLLDARYRFTCSTRTVTLGLPALAMAGWLLRRGLTRRPVVAGTLAGLGSGLLADSSWRVYCEVSDPQHVLSAHAAGIVALAAIGALAGAFAPRLVRLFSR